MLSTYGRTSVAELIRKSNRLKRIPPSAIPARKRRDKTGWLAGS
ncbi:hypothetical protein RRSWK_01520 [Rhodopirellula sp. SWK7]|nr:hypothetical protein RRSWK_01520 [Rhodopirellula sp. SWK7]